MIQRACARLEIIHLTNKAQMQLTLLSDVSASRDFTVIGASTPTKCAGRSLA